MCALIQRIRIKFQIEINDLYKPQKNLNQSEKFNHTLWPWKKLKFGGQVADKTSYLLKFLAWLKMILSVSKWYFRFSNRNFCTNYFPPGILLFSKSAEMLNIGYSLFQMNDLIFQNYMRNRHLQVCEVYFRFGNVTSGFAICWFFILYLSLFTKTMSNWSKSVICGYFRFVPATRFRVITRFSVIFIQCRYRNIKKWV